MTRVLTPRSDTISSKELEATDFEKYFRAFLNDYLINGLTVTAGAGLSVDITSGEARIKGLHCENTATENLTGLTDNAVNKILVQINRDGASEPESFTFTSTTGAVPTDAMQIATATTSGGSVTGVTQVTGTDVNVDSGIEQEFLYGSGEDGDVTISSPLTLTETKFYNNLIINSSQTLDGATPQLIYVKDTLTVNGILSMSGKGASGGAGGAAGSAGSPGPSPGGTGGTGGIGGDGVAGSSATNLNATGGKGEEAAPGTGGAGGPGDPGPGNPGVAGTGSTGGGGGAGGGTPGVAGGDGGPGGSPNVPGEGAGGSSATTIREIFSILEYFSKDTRANLLGAGGGGGSGATAGGGGGGGGNAPGSFGGAGGAGGAGGIGGVGGGTLVVLAKNIVIGSGGSIQSNGAAGVSGLSGANGVDGTGQGGLGRGGGGGGAGGSAGMGGGGGSGGCIILIRHTLTDSNPAPAPGITVAGGGVGTSPQVVRTGGTGGSGFGPGNPGGTGADSGDSTPAVAGVIGGVGLLLQYKV